MLPPPREGSTSPCLPLVAQTLARGAAPLGRPGRHAAPGRSPGVRFRSRTRAGRRGPSQVGGWRRLAPPGSLHTVLERRACVLAAAARRPLSSRRPSSQPCRRQRPPSAAIHGRLAHCTPLSRSLPAPPLLQWCCSTAFRACPSTRPRAWRSCEQRTMLTVSVSGDASSFKGGGEGSVVGWPCCMPT